MLALPRCSTCLAINIFLATHTTRILTVSLHMFSADQPYDCFAGLSQMLALATILQAWRLLPCLYCQVACSRSSAVPCSRSTSCHLMSFWQTLRLLRYLDCSPCLLTRLDINQQHQCNSSYRHTCHSHCYGHATWHHLLETVYALFAGVDSAPHWTFLGSLCQQLLGV